MLKIFVFSFISIFLIDFQTSRAEIKTDSVNYGKFGRVMLYEPEGTPDQVVLFISGDAGWKSGVVDMAKRLAGQGALVLGIDILHYLKMLRNVDRSCYYISGDFEYLNEYVQKKLKFEKFLTPVLAGYSSGATMAYALIAQAPDNTYKGALALGFDPGIEINKPLCKGSGLQYETVEHGYELLPRANMSAIFVVLDGDLDKFWNIKSCRDFMSKIKYSKLYELQHVGHGFSVAKNWVPQFISGYNYILSKYTPPIAHNNITDLKSLPIIEIPSIKKNDDEPMMISYSGDGGWRGFINNMALNYSEKGIPVIGIDVLKYFWNECPPQKSADDLAAIIEYYSKIWHRQKIILSGYSFGAEVLPFIYDRLPEEDKSKIIMLDLMSPSDYADFTFHFSDWLDENSSEKYKLIPEIKKIEGPEIVIVFGKDETEDFSEQLAGTSVKIVKVEGNHHYNYNLEEVIDPVLLTLNPKK